MCTRYAILATMCLLAAIFRRNSFFVCARIVWWVLFFESNQLSILGTSFRIASHGSTWLQRGYHMNFLIGWKCICLVNPLALCLWQTIYRIGGTPHHLECIKLYFCSCSAFKVPQCSPHSSTNQGVNGVRNWVKMLIFFADMIFPTMSSMLVIPLVQWHSISHCIHTLISFHIQHYTVIAGQSPAVPIASIPLFSSTSKGIWPNLLRSPECDWWCGFLVQHWERADDREVWLMVWFPGTAYIGSVLRTGKCDWWCGFLVHHILGACWGQGSVIDGVVSWYSIYWERAEDREVWLMVWFPATTYIRSVLRTRKCDWWCGFLLQHILGACWGQGSVIDCVVSWYSIYWERAEDKEVRLMVWFPGTTYIGIALRTGRCDWWCGFLVQHILGAR